MTEFELELAKIIDPPVAPAGDLAALGSLKELYAAKKSALGLSDRQIQAILGIDAKTLNPILSGTAKQVNFVNILKLAHFLGLSVSDVSKAYVKDMATEQIAEIQRAREAGYIVENFDVAALTREKFFERGASAQSMAERVKRFFGLESVYSFSDNEITPAFSRTKRSSGDLMRRFWVQSAYTQFAEIANPNPYDRARLLDLMPRIRPYTRDVKNGLLKVLKALYNVGVTVIFQPSLGKVQVRGATMVVNDKPCVVISDHNKRYPTLWFTLLHELHHVLYDIDDIRRQTYHISDNGDDLFLMNEEKADDFATEFLLSESRLKFASGYIRSDLHIQKMARDWYIHPSIIYAMYCYKTNEWQFYGKHIPQMDAALELINTHPFERETLMESVAKIKELIYN